MNHVLFFMMKSITFSSYATIWFLPALWMGVSICYFLLEYFKKRVWTFGIVLGLWVVGILNDPYVTLLVSQNHILMMLHDAYLNVFISFRDGAFYAAAYILVGYCISQREKKFSLLLSGLGIVVTQALFLVEAIWMKKINPASNTDMAIMLLPSVYFILVFLVNIDIKGSELLKKLRNYSMLIFLGQRLFLTAIPSVLPVAITQNIQALPQIAIYSIFVLTTILFAIIIECLSYRFTFLKNLM